MKIERDYEKDYQETLPSGPQSSRRVKALSRPWRTCPSRGTPKTAADHYSATSPSPPTELTASVATQSQRPPPTPPSQQQTIRPEFLGCARWEVYCRSIHPSTLFLEEFLQGKE